MKSILRKITGASLLQNNEHLENILDNDEFIEIGNINNKVMNNLLKGKLVRLEDLSCFQIQNIGLGRSEAELDEEIDNQNLKNMLPYISLDSKIKNHSSCIVVVTYGLLVQKVNRNGFSSHEEFTPMVLIPVEMYFDGGISFQMISLPFANPHISIIRKASQRVNSVEVLNNMYLLDKFCMGYSSFADIKFECFVSYINVNEDKFNFTDKYYHPALNFYNIDHRYNLTNDRIINITQLNKNQRVALERAHDGHSFEIIGSEGTGKTTLLTNIACDAIHNGKRVLYLSNSIPTLEQVYSILESKEIASVASKLYLPFNKLREKNVHNIILNKDKHEILEQNQEIKQELSKLYEDSDKYIGFLYKRINNFYVIDVINNCIKYKDVVHNVPKEAFEGIDGIYHEELSGVIEALTLIDQNIKSIDSIKESVFSSIPSTIDAYPEDVICLLRDMSLNYKTINKIKDTFANQYGCVSVENYAYLRSVLSSFFGLDKSLVPDSWFKYNETGLYEFEHAKKIFEKFKLEMELHNQKEKTISDSYNVEALNDINIDKIVSVISNKFKGFDNRTINKFLKENEKLISSLDDFIEVMKRSEKNYELMNQIIKCKIDFSNDVLIENILAFMINVDKHNYSRKWLAINKQEEVKKKIETVKQTLDKYDEEKKMLGIIDTKHLSEYIDSLKLKCRIHFKNKDLKQYLEKVEELYTKTKGIDQVYKDYFDLTGEEYSYESNPTRNFEHFVKSFERIDDFKIKRGIAKLLAEKTPAEARVLIKPFIEFSEYYVQVNQKHRTLCNYYLTSDKQSFSSKVKDIMDNYEFCKKIKGIQEKVQKCIKESKFYIILEDINLIKVRLNDRKAVEKSIDNNEEYKNLLSPLYVGYKTDIKAIEKLFNSFEKYCKIFTSLEAINKSFTSPFKIRKLMEDCGVTCGNIVNDIKNYTKYFKQDIDFFYYENIEDVYRYIENLLKKEDELNVYLNLNRGLNGLQYNGLYKLYEYIKYTSDKKINYTEAFNKEYFNNLLEMFKKKISFDSYEIDNYDLLYKIIEKEEELIHGNVELLINELKPRYTIKPIKNMDYVGYINKTIGIKNIFLSTPKTFNLFLEPNFFDCIIIDDAQILDTNEFKKALGAKQVIVAGPTQAGLGIKDDLLSIMRRTATVKLTYKYETTPLSIVDDIQPFKCKFLDSYDDNKGVIYSRVENERIFEEILNDCGNDIFNKKINIYLEDEKNNSYLLDKFSSLLRVREYSNEAILNWFKNNVNICSIKRNFSLNADYSILYLKDYINEDDSVEVTNYLNVLASTKYKLVICDEDSLINSDTKTEFAEKVRKLIRGDINFKKNYSDDSVQKVIEAVKEKNVRVLGSIGNYALILKKKNMLYGVIFFDLESLHESNVLNLYRNIYYGGYIKTTCLFLFDLVSDFDGCINKVMSMMEEDNESVHD